MNSKERLIAAMRREIPDRVPCTPDMSNMIPCRLTGKPFWDIYLYNDPPLWEAYIDAAKYFGIDSWQPAYLSADKNEPKVVMVQGIIEQTDDRIVTQIGYLNKESGDTNWTEQSIVYPVDNPPTIVKLSLIGLEPQKSPKLVENVKPHPGHEEFFKQAYEKTGDSGILGIFVGPPGLNKDPQEIYDYYDHTEEVIERARQRTEQIAKDLPVYFAMQPDFILTGYSGMMTFMSNNIFRELSLPAIQLITRECKKAGIPSMIHCCGRERDLVKICAEETDLDCINPLEILPMGDCNLADLKKLYGDKLCLMGNLHTTEVMLRGTPETVAETSKKAIDDAGGNGGFILSTGDQCGRDTPDENIYAMVEVCKTYGCYK